MSRGRLIVFEGGDGVGKSTQIDALADWLDRRVLAHCITREPGGCALAEQLREWITAGNQPPLVELMLLMSARAAHVAEVIRPALDADQWVLCDRFVDSTLAYQGAGLGMDRSMITTLQNIVAEGIAVDLTILLDMPAAASRTRKSAPDDGIEARNQAFRNRVHQGFRYLAAQAPQRYLVLDATQPVDTLHRQITARLDQDFG